MTNRNRRVIEPEPLMAPQPSPRPRPQSERGGDCANMSGSAYLESPSGQDESLAMDSIDTPTVEENPAGNDDKTTGKVRLRRPKSEVLKEHAKEYCEQTSLHGFAYFVASQRLFERLCWATAVIVFTVCASIMVYQAVDDWIETPGETKIETFSKHVSQVPYPAITLCNPANVDTGEYSRAIFNNLKYDKHLTKVFNGSAAYIGRRVMFLMITYARDIFADTNDPTWLSSLLINLAFENLDRRKWFYPLYATIGRAFEANETAINVTMGALFPTIKNGSYWKYYKVSEFLEHLEDPEAKDVWERVFACGKKLSNETASLFDEGGCLEQFANDAVRQEVDKLPVHLKFFIEASLTRADQRKNYCAGRYIRNMTDCTAARRLEGLTFNYRVREWPCVTEKTYFKTKINCTKKKIDEKTAQFSGLRFLLENEPSLPPPDFGTLFDHFSLVKWKLEDQTWQFRETKAKEFSKLEYEIMTKNLFGDLNLTFVPNDGRIVRFDHPDGTFKFVQVDHDGWPNPAKLSKFVVTGVIHTLTPSYVTLMKRVSGSPKKLMKLFKYNSWLRGTARKLGVSQEQLLATDLATYTAKGILQKEELKIPPAPPTLLKCSDSDLASTVTETVTDYGSCVTINGNSLSKTFIDSQRTATFVDMFDNRTNWHTPTDIKGSGSIHETVLWLNMRNPMAPQRGGKMRAAINDWRDFFAVRGEQMVLTPGHIHHLKVIPSIQSFFSLADVWYRVIKIEGGSSLFKYYTQKACVFECLLKFHKLPCLPWDYPELVNGGRNSDLPTCLNYPTQHNGTAEFHDDSISSFESHMIDLEATEYCEAGCLPNCEETVYDYSVSITEIDFEDICDDGTETRKMALDLLFTTDTVMTHLDNAHFSGKSATDFDPIRGSRDEYDVYITKKAPDNVTTVNLLDKMCIGVFEKHIGKLIIQIGKPRVLEVVKDIRVTFPDMLGTIGGTIGLFTGLSLLSVVEIVYWIYKTARALCKN